MKAMISALSALGLLAAMVTSLPAVADDAAAANTSKGTRYSTIKHEPIKHIPIKHVAQNQASAAGQSGSTNQPASPGSQQAQKSPVDPMTGKPNIYVPKTQTSP